MVNMNLDFFNDFIYLFNYNYVWTKNCQVFILTQALFNEIIGFTQYVYIDNINILFSNRIFVILHFYVHYGLLKMFHLGHTCNQKKKTLELWFSSVIYNMFNQIMYVIEIFLIFFFIEKKIHIICYKTHL
jgi:hypothetical protein